MEDYRININYAKALFITAHDAHQLDAVSDDMRLVNSVCCENHVLNVIFANPTMREDKKVAILKALFEAKVTPISMAFMAFVAKKRRTINLKGISNAFLELYRQEKGIVLSELVTAVDADEETCQAVRKVVGEYTQKEVELKTRTDQDVIGGFSITFDNNMYDARISSYVMQLRKEFSKNLYESKL